MSYKMLEEVKKNNQLTGQNFFKTKISPLGSIVCLAARVSITIDLAGNHEFIWNWTLCKGRGELFKLQKTKQKVKWDRKDLKPLFHLSVK